MSQTKYQLRPFIHFALELEQDIIGACLMEKTAMSRVYGLLKPDYFYHTDCQNVFAALCEMEEKRIPIDLHTTTVFFVELHGEEIISGNIYWFLASCMTRVCSSAHLEYHCFLIREMWKRRQIIKIRTTFPQDEGFDHAGNIAELSEQINEIVNATGKVEWSDMSTLVYKLFVHQYEMAEGKKTFVTSGFRKIDNLNGGFFPGQMIVIGARPSVGKSALMGKMGIAMARQGKKVGIVSLEMNNTEIAARLSSLDADIEFSKVFRTIAQDEKLHRSFYEKVSKSLVNLPIYVSDATKVNMVDIRAKAMKLRAGHGCDVLIIDYLQLIDTEAGKQANREQMVSQMSRGIKLLAMEMEIPVVVLCQLNRQQTARSYDQRFPRLSDLRESGAIEQDADVVMFIHRDFMSGFETDEAGNSTERNADLLCSKWRNGAPCHLKLGFEPEKMNFLEEPGLPSGFVPINYSESNKTEEDPF